MSRITKFFAALFTLAMTLTTQAAPLAAGSPAPEARGTTDAGETLVLSELYSKQKYTLVYFYPKADTGGCTAQGCSLRDSWAELGALGVAVVGVSMDSVEAQHAFRQKNRFPFPLIADTEGVFVKAFGVPALAGFAKRSAFLIAKGQVVWADHAAATGKQAEDVVVAIKALEAKGK